MDSSRALVWACFLNNELQKRKEKQKKIASNGACYSDRRSELCAA
jgi:hypothetical protein